MKLAPNYRIVAGVPVFPKLFSADMFCCTLVVAASVVPLITVPVPRLWTYQVRVEDETAAGAPVLALVLIHLLPACGRAGRCQGKL
eukprot:scaffold492218_cov18-Prasinocladus_malaysianus.AAC.1